MTEGRTRSDSPFWVLRAAETVFLLTSLVGVGLFAWSLVDIVRIESSPVLKGTIPPLAWPGVAVFFGSMVALQVVRVFLNRYRGDDGAPRGDKQSDAKDT